MSSPSADAPHDTSVPATAVWTIPNVISMVRIGLIGVFGWLLVRGYDGWAIIALAGAGISDFLDGFLARRWHQVTRLGRILDPAADRMLTFVVVLGLALRGVIPWWLLGVLFARDAMVGIALVIARARGVRSPQVTFMGKVATACLYVFLPLAFLSFERWEGAYTVALMGACGAAVLYWVAGIGYVKDISERAHEHPGGASPETARNGLG